MSGEQGKKQRIKRKKNSISRTQEKYFYGFISLWMIGFFVFVLGPVLYSLYASFTEWNGITAPELKGIVNYLKIFLEDDLVGKSILNTLAFTIVSVPLNLLIGLILATLLNKRYFGSNFFRALFYMPSVMAGVAIYIAWTYLMNTNAGIFNLWLSRLGIDAVGWLSDPKWAMSSIILVNATSCGGQMLIILAGLQDIPKDYYESAMLDGAGPFQRFFRITLPLLTPVVFFNVIMSIIAGLQVFTQPWILTQGGPLNATYVYGIHLYNNAFRYYRFGYSCAMAWLLLVVVLGITGLVFKSGGKWVFYRD